MTTVWRGSEADLEALQSAVKRNCTCVPAEFTCAAHEMLDDQLAIDHLVFVAKVRRSYLKAEFVLEPVWP